MPGRRLHRGFVVPSVFCLMLCFGVAIYSTPARGDAFNVTRKDSIGTASVQFYYGRDSDSSSGGGPSASITTRPGVLGATALASANSGVRQGVNQDGFDELEIYSELDADYLPSHFGGDNPGGLAAASMVSIIEFEIPGGPVWWNQRPTLRIRQDEGASGATYLRFENLTQSRLFFETTSPLPQMPPALLSAEEGDLLRLTIYASGSVAVPPYGAYQQYESELQMTFWTPEPSTLGMVLIGMLLARPLRRTRGLRGASTH